MTISFRIYLPESWIKYKTKSWFSSYASGRISENKAWEWQTDYFGWNTLFNLELDLVPTGRDHAGVGFSLTILGFMVEAKIYDSRHWDEENGTWEKYDDASMVARQARYDEEDAARLAAAEKLVGETYLRRAKLELVEFLETPPGKSIIDQKVKSYMEAQWSSKEAKKLRGESHRVRNQQDIKDQPQ